MVVLRTKTFDQHFNEQQQAIVNKIAQPIEAKLRKLPEGKVSRELNNNIKRLGKLSYDMKGTGQRTFKLGNLTIHHWGDKARVPKSNAIDTQTSIDFGDLMPIKRKSGISQKKITRSPRAILNSPDVAVKATRIAIIDSKGKMTTNKLISGAQTSLKQSPKQLKLNFK